MLSNWGGAGPGGDANRDGQVNFDDITAVLANWGCEPMLACPGDADGDGNINFDDITTILANWNASGALGDANGDGQVNFDDITSVLASWQAACRFRMSTNAETLVVAQLSHRFLLHP